MPLAAKSRPIRPAIRALVYRVALVRQRADGPLHDSAASVQEVRRALQSELNALPAGPTLTVDALQAQIAAAQPKMRALITAHSHSALAETGGRTT